MILLRIIDSEGKIMSQAIEDLKHEHEVILMSLKILGGICREMESGQIEGNADPRAFIDFLKEFADKCHHGKEENMLFPALVSAGIARDGGPVGVMLHEHAEGRKLIQQMESGISPTLNVPMFLEGAYGYTELLQKHIQKENEILFPMAERVLTPDQLDDLFKAFGEFEEKVIGAGRHDELHELLKKMKHKYLA